MAQEKINNTGKYWVIAVSMALIMSACKEKTGENADSPATQLYTQSVEILHKNIKLIQKAKTKKELDSLYNIFEEEITTLNLSYPAETDFKMTEAENDSLTTLTFRINHLRDSISNALTIVPIDSISNIE